MKITTKKVFHCEYCPKYMLRQKAMEKHELWCHNNPKNSHACWSCDYLEVINKSEDKLYSWSGGPALDFRCIALEKHLYSYKAEKTQLLTRFSTVFADAERMPSTCIFRNDPKAIEKIQVIRDNEKKFKGLREWLVV